MGDDDRLLSRLDFDQAFGTAINRFCCQAVIGHGITIFGNGHQKRGFLPMRDSIQCLTIGIENPPEAGEYRVFNQFEETYSVVELAELVHEVGTVQGLDVTVHNYENPRHEAAEHYYNPDRNHLIELGYQPTHDVKAELTIMLGDLLPHRERILQKRDVLVPDIRWDTRHRRSEVLHSEVNQP
jgi:UDP-sulfoquinovose synthase